MYQVLTDKWANPYQSAITTTNDFRVEFKDHSRGGYVVAVTPGWGIVKTVVKKYRVFQLSPGALGVRVGE